jgi:hypothetical protein
LDVVDLAVVGGSVAAGLGAATVFGDELATMKQHERRKMDEILDTYEALDGFPPIGRDAAKSSS